MQQKKEEINSFFIATNYCWCVNLCRCPRRWPTTHQEHAHHHVSRPICLSDTTYVCSPLRICSCMCVFSCISLIIIVCTMMKYFFCCVLGRAVA